MKKTRVFIIGNGFDLQHGLNTSYNDFRTFLCEKCDYKKLYEENALKKVCLDNGKNDICFLIDLLDKVCKGNLWSDIEDAIGYFDYYVDEYLKEWDDVDPIKRLAGAYLANAVLEIPIFVENWIDDVIPSSISKKQIFEKMYNSKTDQILSFNYTELIEKTYGIYNVCHIHGLPHNNLIFGHGYEMSYSAEFNLRDDLECGLVEAYQKLKKNTEKQIKKYHAFFEELNILEEIYSYGFSFSKPDIPYIQEICKHTDRRTCWHLSGFETEAIRKNYISVIMDNGFKGSIGSKWEL